MNPLLWNAVLLGMLGLTITRPDLAMLVGISVYLLWENTH